MRKRRPQRSVRCRGRHPRSRHRGGHSRGEERPAIDIVKWFVSHVTHDTAGPRWEGGTPLGPRSTPGTAEHQLRESNEML